MYQYDQDECEYAGIKRAANEWGKSGWRLMQVIPPRSAYDSYSLIFEREVPTQTNVVALRAA